MLVILHFRKGTNSVLLKADRFTLFFLSIDGEVKERNCFSFIKKSYEEKGNDHFWPQRRPTLLIKINRQGSSVCPGTVGVPPHPPLTHLQLELTVSSTRTACRLSTRVTQHPCPSERLFLWHHSVFFVKFQRKNLTPPGATCTQLAKGE